MTNDKGRRITRRNFFKAAGLGSGVVVSGRVRAATKTLKILQWSHFVPMYDNRKSWMQPKSMGPASGAASSRS